ncbi:hypothetical protein C4K40_5334 [Pseudomonas sp. CMR5c]|nr:hypothetical protein C4K40_5334 [Pseudomonas sp. CMR5c]
MMSRSRQLSYFDRFRTTPADYCPNRLPLFWHPVESRLCLAEGLCHDDPTAG